MEGWRGRGGGSLLPSALGLGSCRCGPSPPGAAPPRVTRGPPGRLSPARRGSGSSDTPRGPRAGCRRAASELESGALGQRPTSPWPDPSPAHPSCGPASWAAAIPRWGGGRLGPRPEAAGPACCALSRGGAPESRLWELRACFLEIRCVSPQRRLVGPGAPAPLCALHPPPLSPSFHRCPALLAPGSVRAPLLRPLLVAGCDEKRPFYTRRAQQHYRHTDSFVANN